MLPILPTGYERSPGFTAASSSQPHMTAAKHPCLLDPIGNRPQQAFKAARRHPHRATRSAVCRAAEQVYTEPATAASANGAGAQPGLIFGCGREGAWDAGGVGNPVVRCFLGDDEQRWCMWYNGHSAAAVNGPVPAPCIGLAISQDGVNWLRGEADIIGQQGPAQVQDVGKCLGPNKDWWWHDTRHVSVSDVQIFSSDAVNTGVGVYWMFYAGGSFEEAGVPAGMPGLAEGREVEGLRTRVGLAMSQDGRNWARIEAGHHTGALFDVGGEGQWDQLLNGAPQVLAVGPSDMRMYYHSFDAARRKWVVGIATSKDGFDWTKRGPVFEGGQGSDFDAHGAAAHNVVKDVDSKRYVMFYEAVAADDSRSISVAVSKDGITGWKRLGRPILAPQRGSAWDSGDVGAPCAVPMADGKWRLYYGGRQARGRLWEGIGLAITDAESIDTFEGIHVGFKRRAVSQQSGPSP